MMLARGLGGRRVILSATVGAALRAGLRTRDASRGAHRGTAARTTRSSKFEIPMRSLDSRLNAAASRCDRRRGGGDNSGSDREQFGAIIRLSLHGQVVRTFRLGSDNGDWPVSS